MTTLTISHCIFLSRDERYRLFHGEDLTVTAVSTPVWIKDGETTEPAIEVFTKYKIMNRDERIFIRQHNGLYEITIPPLAVSPNQPLPDIIWNAMTQEQRNKWWLENESNPSLIKLLDIKDGGCGWLAFRQYSKLNKTNPSIGTLHVIHFVQIEDTKVLLDTLT